MFTPARIVVQENSDFKINIKLANSNFVPVKLQMTVAMAWSVESLPSNPAGRAQFLAESGILISILGLSVSFVFCPVLSLAFCREAHPCVPV